MAEKILITGATGHAGREVVSSLKSQGKESLITVASRRPEKAGSTQEEFETRYLDFHQPDTFKAAVSGCSSIFLMRPPAISNTKDTLNVFIDDARKEGVNHIVFLSVAGAAENKLVPHHAVEQHLMNGPKDWTILRPGFFAQNLKSAYRQDILEHDRIYVPAKEGKVAFIDLRDLGEIAADILTSGPHHTGKTYTLTGPRAYTFFEVADLLSQHLERTIKYTPASIPGYMYHLVIKRNLGLMQAIVQTVLHTGLRYGQAETVDPTMKHLLSRSPHDVATYIRDHAHLWEQE